MPASTVPPLPGTCPVCHYTGAVVRHCGTHPISGRPVSSTCDLWRCRRCKSYGGRGRVVPGTPTHPSGGGR